VKIGIIGGGQLARMIIESCNKYAFEFFILSKEKNSPAGQITNNEITGDWNDEECLKEFSGKCDIITLENEFIDYKKIKFLESTGIKVYPDSRTIKLVQDKLYQKETLEKINIPVSKFCKVETKEDIINFAKINNFPVILKSRTMGYDGKGNYAISSASEADKAFNVVSERGELMCEKFVGFEKEIATQVVRNKSGEVKIYPVVETIQKEHICNLVIASRNQFDSIKKEVEEIAVKIVSELDYIGVMGIEMFLTGNEILINELAPRVHNSGHYTIEGSNVSQFENHIRAVLNLPLGSVEMKEEISVMINILGDRDGEAELDGLEKVLSNEKAHLHIYGKKETSKGRKMGHITVTGDKLQTVINTAYEERKNIKI
jgi:5-(carboxyamino)imidazole ribonucleotide synthase